MFLVEWIEFSESCGRTLSWSVVQHSVCDNCFELICNLPERACIILDVHATLQPARVKDVLRVNPSDVVWLIFCGSREVNFMSDR
jgi:hypothetical protein